MRSVRRNWQKRRKKKKKDNANWTRTPPGAQKILIRLQKQGRLNEEPERGHFCPVRREKSGPELEGMLKGLQEFLDLVEGRTVPRPISLVSRFSQASIRSVSRSQKDLNACLGLVLRFCLFDFEAVEVVINATHHWIVSDGPQAQVFQHSWRLVVGQDESGDVQFAAPINHLGLCWTRQSGVGQC